MVVLDCVWGTADGGVMRCGLQSCMCGVGRVMVVVVVEVCVWGIADNGVRLVVYMQGGFSEADV